MSSILKALRKLEEEKARSKGGTPDIARNILRTGPRRERKPWALPVYVASLLLAFGLAGYFLGGEFTSPPPPPPLPAMAPAGPAPPAAETPSTVAEPSQVFQPPATVFDRSTPTVPAMAKKTVSSPPLATSPPDVPKTEPKQAEPRPEIAEKGDAAPRPHLVLTGIAFQDEREGRMAIVNDLPVMEGTTIEGARIVEISRDRVRFEFSGRSFEVRLEATE